MKRLVCDRSRSGPRLRAGGYTLVEILVASMLALMLLGAVITVFGNVSEGVSASRSMIESAEQLRLAAARLQQDLAGVTVTMLPPRKPEDNEGYFEYIEGPITATTAPTVAWNTEVTPAVQDSTVGDFDDILLFTTRSTGRPFVGKCGGTTIQSDVAEVAWFLRGRTLHRRVLLVAPSAFVNAPETNLYRDYDVSTHSSSSPGLVEPNTLSDLTPRNYRYAHTDAVGFPYNIATAWCWTSGTSTAPYQFPTLPTLNECTVSGGCLPTPQLPAFDVAGSPIDFWTNNPSRRMADNALATGARIADDVILNNVIGFDVKAWDPHAVIQRTDQTTGNVSLLFPGDAEYIPTAYQNLNNVVGSILYTATTIGAYVDLGYSNYDYGTACGYNPIWGNSFSHRGHDHSSLAAALNRARTYDTYSTSHFDAQGANGLDDDGDGIVDEDDEKWLTNNCAPPYPIPLRGIQVKIRIFEPESRQVREVTVVQDFLPQ